MEHDTHPKRSEWREDHAYLGLRQYVKRQLSDEREHPVRPMEQER